MKIVFESFKDHTGSSPSFDNPHEWTLEELNELYRTLSETYSMAWNIKLMAVSHHLKSGDFASEMKKLKEIKKSKE